MAHVLLANPRISDFALWDSLARVLLRRGKRVTLLATDAVQARFFAEHGQQVLRVGMQRARRLGDPAIRPHAERDARLQGRAGDSRAIRDAERVLAGFADGVLRTFETLAPDLVITINGRTGLDRLLHDTARMFGVATIHLGDGLIAGTLQRDLDGIDGDRSGRAWQSESEHRSGEVDRAFLDAGLAIALAGAPPQCGPPARAVLPPPWLMSLRTAIAQPRAVRSRMKRSLATWEALVHGGSEEVPATRFAPSKLPHAVVLLQDPADARLLLDAAPRPPSARRLLEVARAAIGLLDLPPHLVVVPSRFNAQLAREVAGDTELEVAPPHCAPSLAATAAIVVTVNHEAAFAGVLAGTPVLCLGRSRFADDRLGVRADDRDLRTAVELAFATRSRVERHLELTHILRDEHLWCDRFRPDPNGLAGLAGWIEAILEKAAPPPPPVHYEPGPTWPGTEMELG
ncbi:MAG: hypothetical protein AB7I19_08315 [Planctomycetota bacterium]